MSGEPDCRALLIVPRESRARVLRELDVVRRIGIDEVIVFDRAELQICADERLLRVRFASD
jgi:hypothetical protein